MLTDTKVAAIKPPAAGQVEHKDSGPGYVRELRLRVGAGGTKTWTVRKRAGDKIVNRKLGTYPAMRLAAARKAAEALLEAIAKDGGTEAADRTFGGLADAWLEKKRADRKRNKSVDHQERQLERHVLPHWRDRKIAEIKRADVRDLIAGIDGEILPNRILALVRAIFRYGLSRDWIEASPADGIARPKDETERDRFLDMAEAKRVWDAAGLLGYPAGPYIRALLLTGQRRTEVASMRWSDVDLDAATWLLKAADTKGDRAHLVPLSAPMLALLEPLPRLGDYVFTNDGETHLSDYAKRKARLDTFIAAGGDPLDAWTLHDLRRTVATHMVRLGVSMEIVGRVLNHAVAGVTAKVYALHEYEPEKRSALDRWAAELMRAVEGKPVGKVVALR
jgi:integrase